MVQEEIQVKDISYQELWQTYCKANHLFNYGKGYYEEQFCEIILNLGQWFRRRCCLNISYLELWGPPVGWSVNIYAISEEGYMGNIHVKLFEIWTSGSGDVV